MGFSDRGRAGGGGGAVGLSVFMGVYRCVNVVGDSQIVGFTKFHWFLLCNFLADTPVQVTCNTSNCPENRWLPDLGVIAPAVSEGVPKAGQFFGECCLDVRTSTFAN